MASFVTVDSSTFDSVKRRIVKFLRFGKGDVRTAVETGPFGVDSSPPKGMVAVYAKTDSMEDTVLVGYLNINQLASPGEHRIYSTDENGVLKSWVWLRGDGTIEMLGTADNLVRFSALETAFNQLKDDFNAFANSYVPGGPSSVGLPATVNPSMADISGAKIGEIKTL